MTTHELANLLDHLKAGLGASVKAEAGKAFDEACAAFRELPDQPLKKLAEQLRKLNAAPTTPRAGHATVDVAQLIARITAVRAGNGAVEGLAQQLESLKNPQLKEILSAFGQKPTNTVAGNLDRAKQLLTTQTGRPPGPVPSSADESLIAEGVRIFTHLRDTKGLSIPDVRAGFEPLRAYPKPVVEEISRRLGYTPNGSRAEVLDRLLSNLEGIKMSQYRSELILTGS